MRPIFFVAALVLSVAGAVWHNPAAGGESTSPEPGGDLRLRDALSLVLARNPELSALSLAVHAHDAEVAQSGAWPNPELSFDLENTAGSGEFSGLERAEATLALSQLIELGGKRGRRRDVSSRARDAAALDNDALHLDVALEATRAFIAVLAAQEQASLAARLVEVAEDTRVAVEAQVSAGAALRSESSRARVAVETSRIDLELAERELRTVRNRLASLWGTPEARFARAVGSLEEMATTLPPMDVLFERVERTPDVSRWETEAQRLRSRAQLERASRVPDLRLAAGVRRINDADETAFVFGVSTPLGLFDRRAQAARSVERWAEQAAGHGRAASLRNRRELVAASETLAGAHLEATRLRDVVLPEAQIAADESSDAYRAGRTALTDVLDAQRTLFQLKSRYTNALARYHTAVAEVERLTGEPVAGLEETR